MFLGDLAEIEADECKLSRVYIAATIAEAERVVMVLNENGIDHFTALELFLPGGFLTLGFASTPYVGVAFYVLEGQASFSRQVLSSCRAFPGVVLE